jgi:hypothetical protein
MIDEFVGKTEQEEWKDGLSPHFTASPGRPPPSVKKRLRASKKQAALLVYTPVHMQWIC